LGLEKVKEDERGRKTSMNPYFCVEEGIVDWVC
jgi:hypothetical protein